MGEVLVVVDVVVDVVVVMVVVEGVIPSLCLMKIDSTPLMSTGISARGTSCD